MIPDSIKFRDDIVIAKNNECTIKIDIKKLLENEQTKDQGKWLHHEVTMQILSQCNYKVRTDPILLNDYLESKFEGIIFDTKIHRGNERICYSIKRDGLLIFDKMPIDIYELDYKQLNKATLHSNEEAIADYCKNAIDETYKTLRKDQSLIVPYIKMALRVPELNYQTQALLFAMKPDLVYVKSSDYFESNGLKLKSSAKPLYILNDNKGINTGICPVYDLADSNAVIPSLQSDKEMIVDYLSELDLIKSKSWERTVSSLAEYLQVEKRDMDMFQLMFATNYDIDVAQDTMFLQNISITALLQSINRMSKKLSEFNLAFKHYQNEVNENLYQADSFTF